MKFSDFFHMKSCWQHQQTVKKKFKLKKVMFQCRGKFPTEKYKFSTENQNKIGFGCTHPFFLHLMMHIQAFTYAKMLITSFYGLEFTKNCVEICQKGKKWPNFAKNIQK